MGLRSSLLRLIPFIVGSAVGIALVVSLTPGPTRPLPELGPGLRKTAEPVASAGLVALIAADDVGGLAAKLTAAELQALSEALAPVVEVHAIRFVDALTIEGDADEVATYVASGLNEQGVDVVSGFALRVRDGIVVGVN
jgi:hypothetical protein